MLNQIIGRFTFSSFFRRVLKTHNKTDEQQERTIIEQIWVQQLFFFALAFDEQQTNLYAVDFIQYAIYLHALRIAKEWKIDQRPEK